MHEMFYSNIFKGNYKCLCSRLQLENKLIWSKNVFKELYKIYDNSRLVKH